ncbi:glycosyltransferase [Actinoplanes sp. NBC_00393]|uniref:glycosyltransferase n=1 Tax=Actinoplanes sp. NBC_00393 TaxID=2975953 RepID=UPI002E20C625
MTASAHDVAILSDFREPGEGIAAEVRVQARAGLATVLVPVRPGPFHPLIVELLRDGLADLNAGEPVDARLLVLHRPRILLGEVPELPRIRAARTVVVLDEPAELRQRLERLFGAGLEWAPVSPRVRAAMQGVPLAATDWHEVIDTVDWWAERGGPVAGVPVLGRHGPPQWPATAEEVLQAYPENPSLRVRLLGGEPAVQLLGHKPDNWELLEPGRLTIAEFLRGLDFFVHFPDPSLVGGFDRNVVEAMAAGVPVVAAEHLRPVLGDAALYAAPAGVTALIHQLYDDPDRCRVLARQARDLVEQRFGPRSHLARLAEHGVHPPTVIDGPQPGPDSGPSGGVLLVSDNGVGLGHLSRLMAIGRRLPPETPAVVATQSHGAWVAHREGFLTEYIPSLGVLQLPSARWAELVRSRLEHLVDLHRPAVVAVDSVPHDGVLAAVAARRDVTWVWVRRPMWRRDTGAEWIDRGAVFDGILEPGEFAGAADEGLTVADRARVHPVEPILYLDRHELIDRDAARAALDLDPDRPAALLQLAPGDVAERVVAHLTEAGFQVLLAEPATAAEPAPPLPGARPVKLYPISRYLRGLDLVVSAAGYNAFHELLAFSVPTVFIPDREAWDDQVSRARFAAAAGAALMVEDPGGPDLTHALNQATHPGVRANLSHRCTEVHFGNGAAAAARWLVGLADPPLPPPPVPTPPVPTPPAPTPALPTPPAPTATPALPTPPAPTATPALPTSPASVATPALRTPARAIPALPAPALPDQPRLAAPQPAAEPSLPSQPSGEPALPTAAQPAAAQPAVEPALSAVPQPAAEPSLPSRAGAEPALPAAAQPSAELVLPAAPQPADLPSRALPAPAQPGSVSSRPTSTSAGA